MTKEPYSPIDLSGVRTLPLASRKNKVKTSEFARVGVTGLSFSGFIDRLPSILVAADFRAAVGAIVKAHRQGRPVIWGMGAHVIKCGLSPLVIELMKRNVITAVAMNGAGSIHDLEIALIGATSEDVAGGLDEGSFGMAEETGRMWNEGIGGGESGVGLALGRWIESNMAPFRDLSILAAGARYGVPVTVHVAIGTDIVHMHPAADGAAIGAASHRDFRTFASVVADLGDGGVYLNIGSAVILPEVFLKALTLARNLGNPATGLTTINMDMQQQYRPTNNVVRRPTQNSGKGYAITGHHEIMVPLLVQAIIEKLSR
ncbi:MAG: hypothetical protein Q7O66_12875 [Dehalococcoidia bacterium]|nr:hypothetical protein [Dehalococcoidia bacterium]